MKPRRLRDGGIIPANEGGFEIPRRRFHVESSELRPEAPQISRRSHVFSCGWTRVTRTTSLHCRKNITPLKKRNPIKVFTPDTSLRFWHPSILCSFSSSAHMLLPASAPPSASVHPSIHPPPLRAGPHASERCLGLILGYSWKEHRDTQQVHDRHRVNTVLNVPEQHRGTLPGPLCVCVRVWKPRSGGGSPVQHFHLLIFFMPRTHH